MPITPANSYFTITIDVKMLNIAHNCLDSIQGVHGLARMASPQAEGRICLPTPPPTPRSIAIIELAGNREIIYGAQSLTGKILISKSLRAKSWGQIPKMGTNATLRTVSASTMITDWESAAQG
jgi:hypothetical protein